MIPRIKERWDREKASATAAVVVGLALFVHAAFPRNVRAAEEISLRSLTEVNRDGDDGCRHRLVSAGKGRMSYDRSIDDVSHPQSIA